MCVVMQQSILGSLTEAENQRRRSSRFNTPSNVKGDIKNRYDLSK